MPNYVIWNKIRKQLLINENKYNINLFFKINHYWLPSFSFSSSSELLSKSNIFEIGVKASSREGWQNFTASKYWDYLLGLALA